MTRPNPFPVLAAVAVVALGGALAYGAWKWHEAGRETAGQPAVPNLPLYVGAATAALLLLR